MSAGCAKPEPTAPPKIPLRVLIANVGNLDEVTGGPCPARPYKGALCSVHIEGLIRTQIDALRPDIAVLMEVVDADLCTGTSTQPDFACTGAASRDPYQQVRRLVGPDFTITCDAIAHYDCIAVRSGLIEIDQCSAGELCMGASTTPPQPPECDGIGSITSVSRVDARAGSLAFGLIAAHPLNAIATTTDPCRLAQYRQAFDSLAGSGPTLVAGDMNYDPYRDDFFKSGHYWHEQVGPGRRFTAHSVTSNPPPPTWGGAVTLDYVLSDFLEGECRVLDGDDRLDGDTRRTDHRGVFCELSGSRSAKRTE